MSTRSDSHLGHMLLECFEAKPERICQIDAATGEKETNASVLARAKRLVRCFRKIGLKTGDVLVLGGRNHLDVHIPYYAALMYGLPVAAMDPFYKYDEIFSMLKITKPKIAFCQRETQEYIQRAVAELALDTVIVNFDGESCNMRQFIDANDGGDNGVEFRPADFDGSKVYAWLTATSGTTGSLKFAAFHHQQIVNVIEGFKEALSKFSSISDTNSLNLSTVQWISAYYNAISYPIFGTTKIQTSAALTPAHVVEIINKYRPVQLMMTPWSATEIVKHASECDLTCFRFITLTGSKVPKRLLMDLRAHIDPTKCLAVEMYGQTETLGPCLQAAPEGPLGNCGKPYPVGYIDVKLIDPETNEEITEPHKPGEMWVKGPSFVEYYGMPEETAKSFTEDGWYRTGDLLYRDENNFYYFYERMKMLIKYKNYVIPPVELEEVISTHPAVAEVAVTSVEDDVCGEFPVACVVTKQGTTVTAAQIQQLVASKLSENKQLRGGVVFVDSLPVTSTGKIARGKLRQLVREQKNT